MPRCLMCNMRILTPLILILVFLPTIVETGWGQPQTGPIFGMVADASSGAPIPGASVLVWDITDPIVKPRPGFGLYTTDETGHYQVDSSYLKEGHSYKLYAFRGNRPNGPFDYIPSKPVTVKFEGRESNVSFKLVQGACLFLEDTVAYIRAEGDPWKLLVTVLDYQTGEEPKLYNADYMTIYGASPERWYLNISERLVIVPSGIRVILKIDSRFFTSEFRQIPFAFMMDNMTYGYVMSTGSLVNISLWEYAFSRNYDVVNEAYIKTLQNLEDASRAGFIVFKEKSQLRQANDRLLESRKLSTTDFRRSLYRMREAYNEINVVDRILSFMYAASAVNAVRLPVFLSVIAVALGFFIREKDKHKVIFSLVFYIILLLSIYLTYPGVATFTSEDMRNFMLSAIASISTVLFIAFVIPRVWREPQVEGHVSLRAVTATIFSMSKREIRRRGVRSLIPVLSLCFMVMAFIALTSFGTVYGLKYETQPTRTPANGILVRRGNDTLNFIPIGTSDVEILSDIPEIINISPKLESLRDLQSLGEVFFESSGRSADFLGTLGIDLQEEQTYVDLRSALIQSDLSQASSEDQLIISRSMAEKLGVKLGDRVSIYSRGIGRPLKYMIVVGVFDETMMESLTDINGRPYLPFRLFQSENDVLLLPCNASGVLIMDWRGLIDIQLQIRSLQPEGGPILAALSRIAFSTKTGSDLQTLIRRLTFALGYTVDVVTQNKIETYSLGYFYEARGDVETIILILMVTLNVGAIMLNAVYERHNEMKTLTFLGLNPAHIGFMFIAEAIVMGILGGGLGYMLGLSFQRVIVLFGQDLMVRSKIEWWWGVIGLLFSIAVSILASFRAASLAIKTYTPSMVKRIKVSQVEKERRKAEVFRIFQAREISMPVRLQPVEVDFFTSYVVSYFSSFRSGIVEKIEEIEETLLISLENGGQKKELRFIYLNFSRGQAIGTRNKIILTQDPGNDFFRISFSYDPIKSGIPEEITERVVNLIKDICYSWVREKDKYVVGFK